MAISEGTAACRHHSLIESLCDLATTELQRDLTALLPEIVTSVYRILQVEGK